MDVLVKAIDTYGENKQLDMCIEEMSELIKEICKRKRGFNNKAEITEEIADVYITLEQLKLICRIEQTAVSNEITRKLNRLTERLRM